MTAREPFAYPSIGNVMVMADGPELLVYSGANDQGIWKMMADDIITGVGATGEHVVYVDSDGDMVLFRVIDGYELSRLATDCAASGMELSDAGYAAILADNAVVLVIPGSDPRPVGLASPEAAAWNPDSTSLAVGGGDGTLTVLDPASGGAWGQISLGSMITGVAWVAQGHWAVAHGTQISMVKADGTEVISSIAVGEPTTDVTVSQDGAVLATIVGGTRVAVYELATVAKVGEVTFQRQVHNVRFGPQHWLAFSFDDGDANRLDVITGKMTRTQAHPGRAQNAWAMQSTLNNALVRGAIANVAAGGSAIAKFNVPKIKKQKKKRSWVVWAVVAVVGLLLTAACCGVGGVVVAAMMGY